MSRYRNWGKHFGRVYIDVAPWALNLPRIAVCCDGDAVNIGLSYGNGNSDPVILLDVDLAGTMAGRLVSSAYWWLYSARHRGYLDRDTSPGQEDE